MLAAITPWIGPAISLLTLIFVAGMKYGDMKQLGKTMDRIEAKTNNHAERIARIEGCLEGRRDKNGE